MIHDFISTGLFSKTEEGTIFHSAKSFDTVLCNKSKTIMFLPIAQGEVYSVKCVSIYSLSLNSMSFSPTLFPQVCLARQKKEPDSIQPNHLTVFTAVNPRQ